MPLIKVNETYHLIHSKDYYGVPRSDSVISYWLVDCGQGKIPLSVVGYKDSMTEKRYIKKYFPDVKIMEKLHKSTIKDEPINLL